MQAAVQARYPGYTGPITVSPGAWTNNPGAGHTPDPFYSAAAPASWDFLTQDTYGIDTIYGFSTLQTSAYNVEALKTLESISYPSAPSTQGVGGGWTKTLHTWDSPQGVYRVSWSRSIPKLCWPGWAMHANGVCTGPPGQSFFTTRPLTVTLDGEDPFTLSTQRWHSCPAGYVFQESSSSWTPAQNGPTCVAATVTQRDGVGQVCLGNPINAGTAVKHQTDTDYDSPTLSLHRGYASSDTTADPLGIGWRLLERGALRVLQSNNLKTAVVTRESLAPLYFTWNTTAGAWQGDGDLRDRLQSFADGNGVITGWQLTREDESVEAFDAAGYLISITERGQGTRQYAYDGLDRLTSITDAAGRRLTLAYDSQNRIISITDPAGHAIAYAYAAGNRLASVTYPGGLVRSFIYNEPAQAAGQSFPNALTGILEAGSRVATFSFDSQGRAVQTQHPGGVDKQALSYPSTSSTTATDALGATRSYAFSTVLGVRRVTAINEACTNCGGGTTSLGYDAQGNVSRITDPNNLVTTIAYDGQNRETSRTEASGTTLARTITTAWHATLRRPVQVMEPGKRTNMTWSAAGDLLSLTLTDTATNATRTWQWTYDAAGRPLTRTGSAGDVTRYAYAGNGDLTSTTNALGHVTTITGRDAHGRVTGIRGPDGVASSMSYDLRGRVTGWTVGARTTRLTRDARGRVTAEAQPDGRTWRYGYDTADRLVSVIDAAGNHRDLTLDGTGNPTREEIFTFAGTKIQSLAHSYSPLGRLTQTVGAASQTTTYSYDAGGRLTTLKDPLNNFWRNQYDSLNRLSLRQEPHATTTGLNQGQIAFGYTGQDTLASVSDPRGLVTTYQRNGFGDLVTETSPDRGATAITYDGAGRPVTRTDALNRIATYQWDALDRPTRIAYSDQTHTYTWDTCTNGAGHLCSVTDAAGGTAFSYDTQGRVTQKTQTVGAAQLLQAATYDSHSRLATLTLPSGGQLAYGYDSQGRLASISVDGVAILASATYRPFGPVSG